MPRRVNVFFHNPDPSRASISTPVTPPPPQVHSPSAHLAFSVSSLTHPCPGHLDVIVAAVPQLWVCILFPACTDLQVLKHLHSVDLYPYNSTSGGDSPDTSFPGYMNPIKNGLYQKKKKVTKRALRIFNWSRRNCWVKGYIFVEEWVGCL